MFSDLLRTPTISRRWDLLLLFLIWIIVTVLNVTKAVHIDDSVYLYGARAVVNNILHPYAAQMSWGSADYMPLSAITQPAFTFYPLAFSLRVFGEAEIPLHLVQSLYSLLAIVCFYHILTILRCAQPILFTSLFAISPAFIPSQNLMTDIPLVSFMLLCFYLICVGILKDEYWASFRNAGVVAGGTCLIKYTGAVVIPLYLLAICFKRSFRIAPLVLIPLGFVLGWSAWTYFDLGVIHPLKSQLNEVGTRFSANAVDWVVCLGAIAPFSLLFLRAFSANWYSRFSFLAFLIFVGVWYPTALDGDGDHPKWTILARCFWANGILVSLGVTIELLRYFFTTRKDKAALQIFTLVAVWLVSGFLFITLLSRFIAVRHLLIVIPPILLVLSGRIIAQATSWERAGALLCTAALGILLGISDWEYANLYRVSATKISEKYHNHQNIWAVGTWGWQWYAVKSGMKMYTVSAPLQGGDIVVVPALPAAGRIAPEHKEHFLLIDEITIDSSLRTRLRTMFPDPSGGFYGSTRNILPWRPSWAPLDNFRVYEFRPMSEKKGQD